MSYHRALGALPPMTSTQLFAEAVDPYAYRFGPPGAILSPYGWGPDFNVGMPFNYTHHLNYVRTPIPGARRNIGTYYDTLSPQRVGVVLNGVPRRALAGSWSGGGPGYAAEAPGGSLGGILAVV